MKKLAYILGVASLIIFCVGIIFKVMHWSNGDVLLSVGIAGFAILFIPAFAKYKYDS